MLKTKEELVSKLYELRKLHFEAVRQYQDHRTTNNLLNIEQLYGRIMSIEWVLDVT